MYVNLKITNYGAQFLKKEKKNLGKITKGDKNQNQKTRTTTISTTPDIYISISELLIMIYPIF